MRRSARKLLDKARFPLTAKTLVLSSSRGYWAFSGKWEGRKALGSKRCSRSYDPGRVKSKGERMQVYSLCSSSRVGSSYVVVGPHGALLIDCGSTQRHLRHCLATLGLSPSDICGCLITHSHPDHVRGIRLVARLGIPIFARPETAQAISARFGPATGVNSLKLEVHLGGGFVARAIPVSHYAYDGSCAFVIQDGEEAALLVTDAGEVPEPTLACARGATYVICEANHDRVRAESGIPFEGGRWRPQWVLRQHSLSSMGHLSNDQAAKALSSIVTRETRAVLLCHLSEDYNRPDVAVRTVQSGLASHGWHGPVEALPPDRVWGPVPGNPVVGPRMSTGATGDAS